MSGKHDIKEVEQLISQQSDAAALSVLEDEAHFRRLSDVAFEALLVHDKGIILDANLAAATMFGCDQDKLVGMKLLDFVAPESIELVMERIALFNGSPFEVIAVRTNGEHFTVEVSARDYTYHDTKVCVAAVRDISTVRHVEESLHAYKQRMNLHVQSTPLAVIEWDTDFRVKAWNPAAERVFGYTEDEAMGKRAADLILPETAIKRVDEIWEQLKTRKGGERSTNDNVTNSGRMIVCKWYDTALVDAAGQFIGVMSLADDITERIHAQKALLQEKELAEVTLASIGDGVITTSRSGEITYINPEAERLTGWSLDEAFYKPISKVYKITDDVGNTIIEDPSQACMDRAERIEVNNNLSLTRRDGSKIPVVHTAAPILSNENRVVGAVLVIRDVSELKNLENKLVYQASHDPLTDLVNRAEFERRVEFVINTTAIDDKHHILMYMDLDQFKVVNDTCGHIAGDELLKQVSEQLFSRLRDTDTLARLGGDEFGVLLKNCPLDKGEYIAEILRNLISEFRFVWHEKTFEIGVSIGLVAINRESGSLTEILSAADSACYVAKDLGRNRTHVYREDDDILAARHGEMRWVHRINDALAGNKFVLYAQRIQPLMRKNDHLHFEVLVRMLDEDGSLIPPGAFIPAAERYNLMSSVDRWVIRNALQELSIAHKREPGLKVICALNISGQSLCNDDLVDFVSEQMNLTGIDPTSICFEITETAAIANLSKAINVIDTFRDMGCRFSLDDFGSGLSSFAYLKNLKVSYLKIDGGFVRDIIEEPINSAMVEAINKIGHVMDLETIAEFVESIPIRNYLRGIGVDYVQGYGIQRPVPFHEIFKPFDDS